MIKKYVNDTPFMANERYLFIPVAAETKDFNSTKNGFVASVLSKFMLAEVRLESKFSKFGFELGETYIVGGDTGWVPPYVLAFAGIHRHASMGWKDAPQAIADSLASLKDRVGGISVATAGIPGTGFSGLKGGAEIEAIIQSLEDFEHDVVVYKNNDAFDREPRQELIPLKSDSVAQQSN